MIWLPASHYFVPSLLKIPTLFGSTALAVAALQPPTLPPNPEELAKFEDKSDVLTSNTVIYTIAACYKVSKHISKMYTHNERT